MDEETKKLIEENLKLSKEILLISKKLKSYMRMQQVVSGLKILLIIVPLILSIIYLPPLLKPIISQYQKLLGLNEKVEGINNSVDINSFLGNIKK